jgi:acetyltransferase-like isoleucine patch superfamily enzyme
MKFFKLKYLVFIIKLIFLKIKFNSKIKFSSYRVGIENNTQIIISGKNSKIIFGNTNYFYRFGNLEVFDNGKIVFGNNVSINKGFSIVSRKSIVFGNNIMIGPNVMIYDHDHNFNKKNIIFKNQGYKSSSITIGDNVWFGANVFISKGVKIGNNVVVAANSVITKDIPNNSLVAGNPFKIIKKINE